ncbi:tubulin glycylase 3A-like isoform X2 [Belonocnema kinseyi]|uniref:tubulin glycylase 3A-like isoform X2 n=1 Tax=Belonocnema kinseyi TaxID=2817044 RepID=UPI00143CED21|nr:tubulin glycylase 3A-like isoform X2 [Belonocnema kinseyi]
MLDPTGQVGPLRKTRRPYLTDILEPVSPQRQMHWYYEPGVANTLFPRCYNLCQGDQMHAFIEDFRFTACLGLLKWLVDKINTEGENAVRSPTGTIPLKALDFAIRRCSDYIGAQSHEDIDQEAERVWSHQWDQFICWYYKIIQNQALFVLNNVLFSKYFLASRHVLKKVRKYWPQLDMDGIMNIWIIKPGNKSRGRGIVLMNKLEDVLDKINPTNKTDNRFVVQKYIERPFLIYETKFDIRQWFMITCAQPLTLWIYKESYLRFCTQKFSLFDFHESIHLCNHAVQCKYTNCTDRDSALPVDNMWDATTFKEFLKVQGHSEAWDELIYPGMKQGLVGSLLASQEAMDRRKNSFELYGADFMVMEDFSVWLIEINSHPDMSSSSSVTTRLCRQVMEDVIKVVIDFREDKSADTGQFELCYKQRMPSCQPYLGAALSLQGTRITASERKPSSSPQDSKFSMVSKSPMTSLSQKRPTVHSQIGPVIVDLIEELEIQLDQEFYSYYKLEHPKEPLPMLEPPSMSNTAGAESMSVETSTKTAASATPQNVKTKILNSSQPNSSKANSPYKAAVQKKADKLQIIVNHPRAKSEVPPIRPSIISKVVELQKQAAKSASIPKSLKSSQQEQSDEKILRAAMKNAVKKYKKNRIVQPALPTLPSLLSPLAVKKVNRGSSEKGKIKKRQYSKKKKVSADVGDMYAVGLSMNK